MSNTGSVRNHHGVHLNVVLVLCHHRTRCLAGRSGVLSHLVHTVTADGTTECHHRAGCETIDISVRIMGAGSSESVFCCRWGSQARTAGQRDLDQMQYHFLQHPIASDPAIFAIRIQGSEHRGGTYRSVKFQPSACPNSATTIPFLLF
jgi:hypothetical protein